MEKLPDFDERDRRRLLVNEMQMKGFTHRTIIEHLNEEDPPVWPHDRTFQWKLKTVKEDIEDIRHENLAAFVATKETTDAARVDYLGVLQSLYEEARGVGNLRVARELAKDIAHAHGLETEEPAYQSHGDPIQLLAVAVQTARKQLKEPPREIEDATVPKEEPKPPEDVLVSIDDMANEDTDVE
jgi:hypothetical protein